MCTNQDICVQSYSLFWVNKNLHKSVFALDKKSIVSQCSGRFLVKYKEVMFREYLESPSEKLFQVQYHRIIYFSFFLAIFMFYLHVTCDTLSYITIFIKLACRYSEFVTRIIEEWDLTFISPFLLIFFQIIHLLYTIWFNLLLFFAITNQGFS